jgi:hypothetical protein
MLGRIEQRLGRNATAVQADPAKMFFLDQQNFFSEMSGALGHHVSAGTRADDY